MLGLPVNVPAFLLVTGVSAALGWVVVVWQRRRSSAPTVFLLVVFGAWLLIVTVAALLCGLASLIPALAAIPLAAGPSLRDRIAREKKQAEQDKATSPQA